MSKKPFSENSYLQKVTLKKDDVSRFIANYLTNIRTVLLVMLLLIAGGVTSFFSIPRTLNPEVKIPIVFISTALPGANPEDVESLITIPIEDKVRTVSNIDTLTATSSQGVSTMTIQFLSTVDADKAKQDIQNAVDTVTGLPEDATAPSVEKLEFEDQPIWTFALVGNTDEASLLRYAETLREEIEDLTKIDRVVLRGFEEQEVQVTLSQEKINTLGINPTLLAQTVQTAINSQPSGTVESDTATFPLSIEPSVKTLQDLREILITANNTTYRLGEIATIAERPIPGAFGAYYRSQKNDTNTRSVTFDIYKSLSERIDTSYEETQEVVRSEIASQNGRFQTITINSMADEMSEQFNSLLKNFAITIALVFVVLLFFFGLRQAIVASFTIPLTFMGALLAMNIFGISLSFLSLFSLLLSLGLLVDVTIVILSAITSYYRTGRFSPREAGLLTWRDYSATLLVTTLTTVWAFSPLLLATGIIGEFIKPIPIVVSATLLSSLLVGMLIVLPFMIAFLKLEVPKRVRIFLGIATLLLFAVAVYFLALPHPLAPAITLLSLLLVGVIWKSRKTFSQRLRRILSGNGKLQFLKRCILSLFSDGLFRLDTLSARYKKAITKIITTKKLRRKTVTLVVLFFLFALSLVGSSLVKNEFFPRESQDVFYVQLELPQGSKIEETKETSFIVTDQIITYPDIEEINIQLATGFSPEGGVISSERNTALLTVNLKDESQKTISSIELAQSIRDEYENFQEAEVSVFEMSGGPPAGADIQITLLGDSSETLNKLAREIIDHLETLPGATNVQKSIKEGMPKVAIIPDPEILEKNGYTVNDAALLLRTFANGYELDRDVSFKDLESDRDIVLRMSDENPKLENIGTLVAPQNPSGAPLYTFGRMEIQPNPARITREDGTRSLSVTASVLDGYSAPEIGTQLTQFASEMSFPRGYTWKTGGVNEENQKSIQSILQAMALAFLLILGTLVIQLRSYRKALIVLLVIPLALTGVFTLFALTGTPLSFPALIGVLALFGIVVNNSIIVVDKINQNLRESMSQQEAITNASASRLEPIFLSSATTIIGLTPITLSDPLWQGLGGAIIAGLIFSGTIMLFFIPVVYSMWFPDDEKRERSV